MGRPKLDDRDKRQQTNFRLSPQDKERLEALAKKQGMTVPALAESLVVRGMALFAHPMMSEKLLDLFVAIMDEMQEMEARNGGSPWYQDLKTWAACKMVFTKGPFARRNPDDWRNSEQITQLWNEVSRARKNKEQAIDLIKTLGVEVSPDPEPKYKQRTGIFGRANDMLKNAPSNRAVEADLINKIESTSERMQALAIFGMIKQYDREEDEALKKWMEQISFYEEDEAEGRAMYQRWRREVVQRQLALGELPHYEDLG